VCKERKKKKEEKKKRKGVKNFYVILRMRGCLSYNRTRTVWPASKHLGLCLGIRFCSPFFFYLFIFFYFLWCVIKISCYAPIPSIYTLIIHISVFVLHGKCNLFIQTRQEQNYQQLIKEKGKSEMNKLN
jgi:hypothetical protein